MVENLDQDLHLIKEKIYDLAGVYIVHFDHPLPSTCKIYFSPELITQNDAILRLFTPF